MSLLAFALLLLVTVAWFMLPLIPALRELLRPSDAEPLTMVGQDAGDLAIFAEGFRGYLRRQLPDAFSLGVTSNLGAALPDGTPVVQLNGRPDVLKEVAGRDGFIDRLVVTSSPVQLPGRETFLLEVYARDDFAGGPEAVYRALLGERDVQLGLASRVLRWVHAEGNLSVGDGSTLNGRASTLGVMRLGTGVRFGRIRAAHVVVGNGTPGGPPTLSPLINSTMKMPRTAHRVRGFIRVDGNLEVPAGESWLGTVVVGGTLTVRPGGRISGNVKVHGSCSLDQDAVIEGSLVSQGDVALAKGAYVRGPVVAEGAVRLDRDSMVGSSDYPASVTGRSVVCAEGAQVFGAISPRLEGLTIPATEIPSAGARGQR